MERLLQNDQLPPLSSDGPSAAEEDNQPFPCYHPGSRWRLLEQDTTSPIQNPNNVPGLVAPTMHATGWTTKPNKFDINEVFDRNPFIAQAPEYEVDKHCKIRKDRDGIPNHKKRAIQNNHFWRSIGLPVIATQQNGLEHYCLTQQHQQIHKMTCVFIKRQCLQI